MDKHDTWCVWWVWVQASWAIIHLVYSNFKKCEYRRSTKYPIASLSWDAQKLPFESWLNYHRTGHIMTICSSWVNIRCCHSYVTLLKYCMYSDEIPWMSRQRAENDQTASGKQKFVLHNKFVRHGSWVNIWCCRGYVTLLKYCMYREWAVKGLEMTRQRLGQKFVLHNNCSRDPLFVWMKMLLRPCKQTSSRSNRHWLVG